MDNNQIIEEIDIIVRAKVEEARKDIQNVAKETKKMVNSVASDMNKFKNTDAFNSIGDSFKKAKEEFQKVIIRDFNVSKSFDASGMFDNLNLDELKQKLAEVKQEMASMYDGLFKSEEFGADGVGISIEEIGSPEDIALYNQKMAETIELEKKINELTPKIVIDSTPMEETSNEIQELSERLKDFDFLTIKDEIKTVGMQIADMAPRIAAFGNEMKKVFTEQGRLIPNVVQKFRELGVGISYIKGQAAQALEPLKAKLESVKEKVGPVASVFANIGKIAKNSVQQAVLNFKELAGSANNPIGKLNKLIQKFRESKKAADSAKKSSSGFGVDIGKGLNKGIKSIKKFALSLLSVRSMFSLVSRAARAYLNFDETLTQAVDNCWNALGSLLAPMIEYVVSLFTKLTSVIASFVKALTGVDLVARANAKALDKQAKATKSAAAASKQLASIDDIDTLSTSKGSGNGDEPTTISVEDIDVTPLMKFLNEAKEILSKLFDPVKEAWEKVGTGVFESMISMFESLGSLCSTVFDSFVEVWTNGTGTEIVTNVLLIWQSLFDIVGGVADAINRAWSNNDNGTKIIQHIANIFNDILKFVLDIGDSLKKWVISEDFQIMLEGVFGVIQDLFGYVEDFADWILKMYEKYLKPVIDDKLLPAITSIIQAVVDIWNAVKPVIDWICGYIGAVLEPVIKGLCGIIGGVIDVIKGIADFISGVFTGNWKKAWNGIKTIFQGAWDTMANIIKTPINAMLGGIEWLANKIIDAFNAVKKALNKISFDIPDWVPFIGGKKWGFDLKISKNITIPRLATGNVATQPTFAMFGEYANARSNPEITSPVSMMKDSFREVLNEFDFGGTRIDTLKIDVAGENFFDKTIDYINEQSERKGVSVIKEV